MSGTKAVEAANEFFKSMDPEGTLAGDQSYHISFVSSDRCSNYALERCILPAPSGDGTRGQVEIPYFGSTATDAGVWVFEDEVTYEKDLDSMKVTIRYAHDMLKETRRHVIMMKNDGSNFLQYDEYTDEAGDMIMARCIVSPPALDPNSVSVRRRLAEEHGGGLTIHEEIFHAHVRRLMPSFGHVHIPKDEDGNIFLKPKQTGLRRRLDEEVIDPTIDEVVSGTLAISATASDNPGENVIAEMGDKQKVAQLLNASYNESTYAAFGTAPVTLNMKAVSGWGVDTYVALLSSSLSLTIFIFLFPFLHPMLPTTLPSQEQPGLNPPVPRPSPHHRRLRVSLRGKRGSVKEGLLRA